MKKYKNSILLAVKDCRAAINHDSEKKYISQWLIK